MTNGHRRIFAGTELAARIERAERSLIAESALAAGRRGLLLVYIVGLTNQEFD
jgi:hypothetical protein